MSTKIPDIRFFDFNFKLLHTENEFLSSNWTVCYNDIGTFEAHFDLESDALPIVMENDYLVVVQGDLSAVMVGKKLGDELIIYGRTCNWLLTKRITHAFVNTTAVIDNLLQQKMKEAFWDTRLVLATSVSNLPAITTGRDDKCETFSFVQETLQLANLGHQLEFDSAKSQWVLRILKGNEQNPLVISTVNRNAYDVTMESDLLTACTQGWYKREYQNMGEWDPHENALLDSDGNIRPGTGITNGTNEAPISSNFGKCFKVQFKKDSTYTSCECFGVRLYPGDFLVCDNTAGIFKKSDKADTFWAMASVQSPNTGILRWESLLSAKSEREARLALHGMQSTHAIQGKTVGLHFVSAQEQLNNECDYALGDVVSVEWQKGNYKKRARKRIIGVNLWYETESMGEEPIFEDIRA